MGGGPLEPKKGDKRLTKFQVGEVEVKIGDTVMMRPPDNGPMFVARVEDIYQSPAEGIMVQAMWYYRPEEATGGRKAYHGERELFSSDHKDWCSGGAIINKAHVLDLASYLDLSYHTENDFFTRLTFKATEGKFVPGRVPVYCKCELPYNPDAFMVMCAACQDWLHPLCINTTREEVEARKHFVCQDCINERRERIQEATKKRRVA
mmetsp:Transcript_57132/g.180828  ORF Transcript_57132/g.180828 Transcript_57132/m.180828 type:complete len:206 (-) Transcript_57132:26-643(-)